MTTLSYHLNIIKLFETYESWEDGFMKYEMAGVIYPKSCIKLLLMMFVF